MAKNFNKNEISFTHFEYRPWGYFEVLLTGGDNIGFKVKKIIVFPNKNYLYNHIIFEKNICFVYMGMDKN